MDYFTLKCDISWTSAEWSCVEGIEVTITEKDIELIKKTRKYIKENPSINYVAIDCDADTFGDEDIRCDTASLRVFRGMLYVFCQSKWDSSDQWEGHVDEAELEKKIKLNKFINNLVD